MAQTNRAPEVDFFQSIALSFQILQLVCLCPYSIKEISNLIRPKFQKPQLILMLIFQMVLIVYVVHLSFHFPILNGTVKLAFFTKFVMIQVMTLALFIESYNNRNVQKDFLLQINSIDFIMEYQIDIKMDHRIQRKHHTKRVISFIGVHLIVFLISSNTIYLLYGEGIIRFAIEFFSITIVALRYYQLGFFADLLYQRYRIINDFMDSANDLINIDQYISKRTNFGEIFDKMIVNGVNNRRRTNIGCDKLHALRRACCSLYKASNTINELFKWTLPLCILTDFFHYLFGVFYILHILLDADPPILLIVPITRFFMVAYHVVFFVIDCGDCTEEVLLIIRSRGMDGGAN